MSYKRHNAIVVTSWSKYLVVLARIHAEEIGMQVTDIRESPTNSEYTFLVCPDGSKEGWDESDAGDSRREVFRRWLASQLYDDGSGPLSWVEIAYGNDGPKPEIVAFGTLKEDQL